jgi:hypothetical protein
VTFIGIVPRDFVEIAPLSSLLLQLPITLLCWWFGLVVLGLVILALYFSLGDKATLIRLLLRWVCENEISLIFLLELLLDFENILVRGSSEEMSKKSIFV